MAEPKSSREAAMAVRRRAAVNSRAHYILAERYELRNRILGVPATALAVAVAAFTFTELSELTKAIVGAFATLGAILVAVQTFLRPSDTARRHQGAAIEYGVLRRKFELLLLHTGEPELCSGLAALFPEVDRLAADSPTIPDSVFRRANSDIDAAELNGDM